VGTELETSGNHLEVPIPTLREIVHTAWRRKRFVFSIAIALAILAGIGSSLLTRVYRAQVVLAPVSNQAGAGRIGAFLSEIGGLGGFPDLGLFSSGSEAENVALLTSKKFVTDYIVEKSLFSLLYPKKWDAKKKNWNASLAADEVPSLNDAYKKFVEEVLAVTQDRDTALITLTIDWRDPELAAQWANELVVRANQQLQGRAISEGERSLAYLSSQLKSARFVEVEQAMFRLMENQMNSMMVARTREEFAFRVVDPAVAPDLDDPFRPRRLLMVLLGGMAGAALAVAATMLRAR